MSSVSKSCPATVTQGDVGILSEEPGQRLLSVFSEAAQECLDALNSMARQHAASKYAHLFSAGIACIGTWNCDVIKEEIAKINAKYPECEDLYQHTYLSLLSALIPDSTVDFVPPMEDFYLAFMKRIVQAQDVKRGADFFLFPFAHRRFVYVECFRNSLHDVLRKSVTSSSTRAKGGRLTSRAQAQAQAQAQAPESAESPRPSSGEPSAATGYGSLLTREKLQAQQQKLSGEGKHKADAAASRASSGGKAAAATVAAAEAAARQSSLLESMAKLEEDKGRRAAKAGLASTTTLPESSPRSDIVPPSSVQSASKKIVLKNGPCFYSTDPCEDHHSDD